MTTPVRHASHPAGSHRVLRGLALATLGAVLFTASAAAAVALRLRTSLDVADTGVYLGGPRPTAAAPTAAQGRDPYAGRALDVLLMGTDLRDGESVSIGGYVDGMRADTTMLVHLPADRSRLDVVSIPRDSLVEIPACLRDDGTWSRARHAHIFNDAFSFGGGASKNLAAAAACVQRTVEQDTGVRIDETVVVKMDGVESVVGALGGLRMCIPEHMDSPKAQLVLDAGWQRLDGRTAIQYLRARTGHGNGLERGSDLARIDRQHQLLDALVAQVRGENLLANPVELVRVLDATARSLSVSTGLADPSTMLGLARSLRGVDVSTLEIVTVPVVPAPQDSNRVVWTSAAAELWQRLAADQPLTDQPPGQPAAGRPAAGSPPGSPAGTTSPAGPAAGGAAVPTKAPAVCA